MTHSYAMVAWVAWVARVAWVAWVARVAWCPIGTLRFQAGSGAPASSSWMVQDMGPMLRPPVQREGNPWPLWHSGPYFGFLRSSDLTERESVPVMDEAACVSHGRAGAAQRARKAQLWHADALGLWDSGTLGLWDSGCQGTTIEPSLGNSGSRAKAAVRSGLLRLLVASG